MEPRSPDHPLSDRLQAEIDGANTAAESEALGDLIRRDASAAAALGELRRVASALDGLESVDPPAGLRDSILEQVRAREAARTGVESGSVVAFERTAMDPASRRRPPAWSQVYVLAAGIVLGLAGGWLLLQSSSVAPEDVSATVGVSSSSSRHSLSAEGLRGSVIVEVDEDAIALRLEVASPSDTEIDLSFDPGSLRILGFDRDSAATAALTTDDSGIRIAGRGEQRFTVRLQKLDPSEATVGLEIRRDGRRILQKSLDFPVR